MSKHRQALLLFLAFLIASACALPSAAVTQVAQVQKPVEIVAAETWSAMQTSQALSATPTFTPVPTDTPTPTEAPLLPGTPSNTPTATDTLVPMLTQAASATTAPVVASLTPVPTRTATKASGGGGSTSPTLVKTATSIPCNLARLVRHLTIPNGSYLPPDTPFTKIWRIQNIGSCEWYTNYYFIPVAGDAMGGALVQITTRVKPGQTIDISVPMIAPSLPGNYKGGWALRVGTLLFGDYSSNNSPFVVEINVGNPPGGVVFRFAENYCSAQWVSNAGNLPCPSKVNNRNGFVQYLKEANTEEGFTFDTGLWTQPAFTPGGYIYGTFPGLPILAGDRFRAKVGCLSGATACNVKFSLFAQQLGGLKTLVQSWVEVFDGTATVIDIDLSAHAGMAVSFTLLVEDIGLTAASAQEARAFWLTPIIFRP